VSNTKIDRKALMADLLGLPEKEIEEKNNENINKNTTSAASVSSTVLPTSYTSATSEVLSRFTLRISNEENTFVKEMGWKNKESASNFIRKLIKKEMQKNKT
jgi:hypothetical protein